MSDKKYIDPTNVLNSIVDENGKTYNVVDGKRFYSEDSKSGKVNKINN